MQKILQANKEKKQTKNYKKLKLEDIEKFYISGFKNSYQIGLEYERISLDKNTLKTASYDKLKKIIEIANNL